LEFLFGVKSKKQALSLSVQPTTDLAGNVRTISLWAMFRNWWERICADDFD